MVLIREAVLRDLPAMLEIYNEAIRNSAATFDLEEQTLEQRQKWFEKYGGNYPLIVAETDGKVVGYSCLSHFREKPAYRHSTEISVYITATLRGKGIGKLLLQEIIDRAKKLGFHTVISGVTAGNEASEKLHEKAGFTLIGRFKEVGLKFGKWQDVHFYQLILETEE
ncbi:N-acetyltransferase [Bacillaceae bacterium Marseille-Q3522]|nr:N-acetyltransferase [Bacillaceae bacterium Marseille-Q3522]